MRTASLITMLILVTSGGSQCFVYGSQSGTFRQGQNQNIGSCQCNGFTPVTSCRCGTNSKPRGSLLDLIRNRRANHQTSCTCGKSDFFLVTESPCPSCQSVGDRRHNQTRPAEKTSRPPSFIIQKDTDQFSVAPAAIDENDKSYFGDSNSPTLQNKQSNPQVETASAARDVKARVEIAQRVQVAQRVQIAPPRTESGPPQTESAPPRIESGPPRTEFAPPRTEFAPPRTEFAPPRTEFAPPRTEIAPPRAEIAQRADIATPEKIVPSATIPLKDEIPTAWSEPETEPALENIQAQPVSTPDSSDYPHIILPEVQQPVPSIPIPSSPIQDPAKERLADNRDDTVVLRARPTGNHNFKPRRYAPVSESHQTFRQNQIPIHQSNYPSTTTYDNMGLPLGPVEFQSLPHMSLPNFQSPAVAKRARAQFADLRAQSKAQEEKERLFDIQALISHEIDKRIRTGKLRPVSNPDLKATQPDAQPRTTLQAISPKPDNAMVGQHELQDSKSGIPILQVSQPNVAAPQPPLQQAPPAPIARPQRQPEIPVKEIEITREDEIGISSSLDPEIEWQLAEQEELSFETPNLFVPVLEASEPQLETQENTELQTDASRLGMIQIDAIASPIDVKPAAETIDEQAELLRLRATTRPDHVDGAPPVVKFRNVSTQYRYQKPRNYEDSITPLEIRERNERKPKEEPGTMEIPTIRAQPIFDSELLHEIRGLTERPITREPTQARIIER